jgi:hypothetical protein
MREPLHRQKENTMPETVQAVRFYNGGDRKFERMQYTALEYNIKIENGVRHFVLDAPRKGFVEVPREIRTEEGGAQLLGLPREVMEKYGERGFVMIDANLSAERCAGEPFMANSEDMAREKGDALWRSFCHKHILEYEENNDKRVAMNMAKSRPSGFTLHAYKELGMMPPGAEEAKKAKDGVTTIEELKESNATLQRQVAALLERMPMPAPQVIAQETEKTLRENAQNAETELRKKAR